MEDWKKLKNIRRCSQNSTAVMLHLSARFYCRAENQPAVYVTMEKELWVYTLACASYPQMQPIWTESHMACAFQGRAKPAKKLQLGANRTSQARQLRDRQDMFPFWLHPPSFPPSFCPSFLSSLCLSILSSLSVSLPLSLHSSPPCNQGPLKWAEETD